MNKILDNLKTGVWFLVSGFIAIVVGFTMFNKNQMKPNDAIATGHYISIDADKLHATKNSLNSKILYHPAVIEFIDSAGQKHTLNTSVPSLPLPALNSEVRVAYDKTHPENAREASVGGKVIAFAAFGIGFVLLGLGVVVASGILQRKEIK